MRVLPHIAELLVPKITDATDWADTIVVTSPDPVYLAATAKLGPDKIVLDFAEFHRPNAGSGADESADEGMAIKVGIKRPLSAEGATLT